MPTETKAERLARSNKKKKRPSTSTKRSKGKIVPGRKNTRVKPKLSPIDTARRQAMNKIRRAATIGDMRKAQDLFFAWAREMLDTLQPNDWIDTIEGELDWVRSEINRAC